MARIGASLLMLVACTNILLSTSAHAQLLPAGPPPAAQAPPQAIQGPVRPQQPPANGPRQLTPAEAQFLDQVLQIWETESAKVKSYKGPFERWEYDATWGPGANIAKTKSAGMLKYMKPDKGDFEITSAKHYNPENQKYEEKKDEVLEHWVCDGKAVYEYNAQKKQLIVRNLPPGLQGEAIVDGPLPFLFGAKKEKLQHRYFFNVTKADESEIWLVAWPRFQQDAANFQKVELILNREKFLPSAMQVYLPGGNMRTVYIFDLKQAKVNDLIDKFLGAFQSPRTPFGWKRVVEDPPAQPAAPAQPQQQATRPRENAAAKPRGPLR